MQDEGKSKEQLIIELEALREWVAEARKELTEHKRYEAALTESEQRFKLLYERTPIAYQSLDENGNFVEINMAWLEALGYAKEEVIGRNFSEFLHPDWAGHFKENFPRFKAIGEILGVEFEMVKKDGSLILVSFHGKIGRDRQGRFKQTHCVFQNITEQRRQEERLRESEKRYRSVIQTAMDGFLLFDIQGRLLDVNASYCRMSGYSAPELLTMNVSDLEDRKTAEDVACRIQKIIEQGEDRFETRHRRKDGSIFEVEVSVQYQHTEVGRFVTFLRDITEQKKAERELREITGRLNLATASARAGVWDWNLQTNEMIWNDRMFELYGLTRENSPGGNEVWERRLHPDDSARTIEKCRSALSGKGNFDTEFRVLRPDGSLVHIKADGLVLRNEQGQPLRMIGLNIDITERKRAEEALLETREQLKIAMDLAKLVKWEYDVKTEMFTFDEQFYSLYGTTLEREGGTLMTARDYAGKFIPPEECLVIAQEVAKALAATDPDFTNQREHRIIRADGQERHIILRYGIVRDESGSVVKLRGANQDITDLKMLEEAQHESETHLRQIIDLVPHMIFVKDWDGKYRLVNRAVAETYNTTVSALTGKYHADFHPDRSELQTMLQDDREVMTRGETKFISEEPFTDAHGQLRFLQTTKVPFQFLGHKAPAVLGIAVDITESKRAEEERAKLTAQLSQAQKMESVGRLAGGVAHDFNNMLGVILGHAEMAMDQVDSTNPLHDDLQEIQKAAKRSADLTRQLLAFARKQTVAPKVLDLNETVEGMLKMLRRLIGEDIDLAWLPGNNLWPVKMDPSQIDQILANLCVNARDAIGDIGKVTIETVNMVFDDAYCADHAETAAGEYVLLAFSDNGCGMDKETQGKLFEPFFTTKAVGEGTGLGLATVYGIVKQNNGFINVYSEPGQGTTFKIYLPRHAAKAEQTLKTGAAEPIDCGHETILLVEDEQAIRKMTAMMLTRQGYTVLQAGTPGEAIRLAEAHPGKINLLMTDVVMPEMNGRDLAKNILSLHPSIKRLFMSGYTANVIAHHGVLDEGVNFIQKPFSMQDLAAKLRQVLGK
jgi:two-component system cell cycle sensor histidine kinase/response regulator CckA